MSRNANDLARDARARLASLNEAISAQREQEGDLDPSEELVLQGSLAALEALCSIALTLAQVD